MCKIFVNTRSLTHGGTRPLHLMKMGALCSTGGRVPDPVTGLTESDIRHIRMLWYPMVNNNSSKQNGPAFFLRLFTKYPYLEEYFPDTYRLSEDGTLQNVLRAHATAVFTSITSYVDCVDDPDVLVALIHKHTLKHYQMGVTRYEMEKAKEVLLEFLQEKTQHSKSSKSIVAFDKFFTLQANIMEARLNELSKEHTFEINPEPRTSGPTILQN